MCDCNKNQTKRFALSVREVVNTIGVTNGRT